MAQALGAGQIYEGRHEPIIEQRLWDRVHAKMKSTEQATALRWTHTHLLKGKLRTYEGHAMSPSTVQRPIKKDGKDTGRRRPIRYYMSQKAIRQGAASCPIKRLNAQHIDDLARALVFDHLLHEHAIDLGPIEAARRDHLVRLAVAKVEVAPETLTVLIEPASIEACKAAAENPPAEDQSSEKMHIPTCPFKPTIDTRGRHVVLTLNVQIKKLDGKRLLLTPDGRDLLLTVDASGELVPKPELVAAIGQAFMFHRHLLESGKTVKAVGAAFGYSLTHASRMLALAQLGPPVLRAVLGGTASNHTTVLDLFRAADHLDWSRQAEHLGLPIPAPRGSRRKNDPS